MSWSNKKLKRKIYDESVKSKKKIKRNGKKNNYKKRE
jgi:hypothetical protein